MLRDPGVQGSAVRLPRCSRCWKLPTVHRGYLPHGAHHDLSPNGHFPRHDQNQLDRARSSQGSQGSYSESPQMRPDEYTKQHVVLHRIAVSGSCKARDSLSY